MHIPSADVNKSKNYSVDIIYNQTSKHTWIINRNLGRNSLFPL